MLRSLPRLRGLVPLAAISLAVAACGGGFELEAGDVAVFRIAFSNVKLSDGCFPDGPPEDEGDKTTILNGQTAIIYATAIADAEEPSYFLDVGGLVLPGAAGEEGTYSFTGLTRNVESMGGGTITDADLDGIDDYNGDDSIDADRDGLDDNFDDESVDVDNDGMDDRYGQDDFVDGNGDGQHDYNPIQVPSDTKLVTTTTYTVGLSVTEDGGVDGTYLDKREVKCDGPNCASFPGTECKTSAEFIGVFVEDATVDAPLGGGNPQPGT